MSPYRVQGRALQESDLTPPSGCPCRMSKEQRQAYAAIGGWEHTDACLKWQRLQPTDKGIKYIIDKKQERD